GDGPAQRVADIPDRAALPLRGRAVDVPRHLANRGGRPRAAASARTCGPGGETRTVADGPVGADRPHLLARPLRAAALRRRGARGLGAALRSAGGGRPARSRAGAAGAADGADPRLPRARLAAALLEPGRPPLLHGPGSPDGRRGRRAALV